MIERILKMETSERLFLNGVLGNPYEFNVLPFNGSLSELSELFCEGYSGLFVFARCYECNGTVFHELHSLGMSFDMSVTLKDLERETDAGYAGANRFCYYYEPSGLVRNDAYCDMLFAHSLSLSDIA